MLLCLCFLVIILVVFNYLTKYTNQIFDNYKNSLKCINEDIPFEFYLNRTKDLHYKIENKVINKYNETKNKSHLIFLCCINILSEISVYLLIVTFAFLLLFCFFNILSMEIITLTEKIVIICLIDLISIFLIIIFLYFLYVKYYKEYKTQKVVFLSYLKSINDMETIYLLTKFYWLPSRLIWLIKRYNENKDDNYLVFIISYSSVYRNYMYIMIIFIFIVFINIFYFLH